MTAVWLFHHNAGVDGDKPLIWIETSEDDISAFPDDVKLVLGFALRIAQKGGRHNRVKTLKGFGGGGVLEVCDDFDGDTYRAVYTVNFPGFVYGLHAFQKKSTKGKETSKRDVAKIKRRLGIAEQDYAERVKARESNG